MPSPAEPPAPRAHGILANFLSLLTGTFGVQLVSLVYLVYAARVLGDGPYGVYTFVLGWTTILALVTDFGRGIIVTREIAISDAARQQRLMRVAWLQQMLFSIGGGSILVASALLVPKLRLHLGLAALAAASIVLQGVVPIVQGYFQGVRRMAVSSTLAVVQNIFRALVGVTLLWFGMKVAALFWALAAAAALGSVMSLIAYRRASGNTLRPAPAPEGRLLLKDGGQTALASLTTGLYNRFDSIVLGTIKSDSETGVYGAAYRLFEVFMSVPGLLALSAFPTLSAQASSAHDPRDARGPLRLALKLGMLPGCLLPLFAAAWGERVVHLLLRSFAGAGGMLAILCTVLPFAGGSGLFYHLLIARRRQRFLVLTSGVAAASNAVFCLLLIPPLAGLGAALAMIVPTILQYFMLAWAVQELRLSMAGLVDILRFAAVTAGCVALAYWLPLPWWVTCALAALMVPPALWYLGGFLPTERMLVRNAVARFTNRGRATSAAPPGRTEPTAPA